MQITNIDELESAVPDLSDEDFARLRSAMLAREEAERKADEWDRQMERDAAAGRLDHLAARAIAQHRAGNSTPL